jgi:hypothetical protein
MPGATEPATGNIPSVTAIGGAATGGTTPGAPSGGTPIGATTGAPSEGTPIGASTGTGPAGPGPIGTGPTGTGRTGTANGPSRSETAMGPGPGPSGTASGAGPTGAVTGAGPAGAATGRTTAMASAAGVAADGDSAVVTDSEVDQVADMVLARLKDKLDDGSKDTPPEIPSAEHAIALREQAPELYDLWLKIAQEKAATENYVDRAPYEIPERLASSGRPRALGALIIVLSFCGYLAWLGGPGPYIGGLIAILDLGAMFGMFFGLRPEGLPETKRAGRKRLLPAGA